MIEVREESNVAWSREKQSLICTSAHRLHGSNRVYCMRFEQSDNSRNEQSARGHQFGRVQLGGPHASREGLRETHRETRVWRKIRYARHKCNERRVWITEVLSLSRELKG